MPNRRKVDKLVRDGIIGSMRRDGQDPKFHIAEDDEMGERLGFKVMEEAEEVAVAEREMRMADQSDRDEARARLTEEIADLDEAKLALMRLYLIDERDVEEARMRKLEEKGGFEQRIVLDEV